MSFVIFISIIDFFCVNGKQKVSNRIVIFHIFVNKIKKKDLISTSFSLAYIFKLTEISERKEKK